MENYIPFLATAGGVSHTAVLNINAQRLAARIARVEYAKVHQLESLWGNDRAIAGHVVKDSAEVPPGWRISQKDFPGAGLKVLIPDRRQKVHGKAAAEQLAAIPRVPGAQELSSSLKYGGYISAGAIRFIYSETMGDKVVLLVPKVGAREGEMSPGSTQFVPPDSTELKLSAYHLVCEEHKAALEAANAAAAVALRPPAVA